MTVPQGCRVGDVGYLIPEAAPGNRAIDIVEVQIPTYVPLCPLLGGWGITSIGTLNFPKVGGEKGPKFK